MMQVLKSFRLIVLLSLLCLPLAAQTPGPNQPGDPRNIKNGSVIPDEGYSDQPYVVITNDGAWLCMMTGKGEGGQHSRNCREFSRQELSAGKQIFQRCPCAHRQFFSRAICCAFSCTN